MDELDGADGADGTCEQSGINGVDGTDKADEMDGSGGLNGEQNGTSDTNGTDGIELYKRRYCRRGSSKAASYSCESILRFSRNAFLCSRISLSCILSFSVRSAFIYTSLKAERPRSLFAADRTLFR